MLTDIIIQDEIPISNPNCEFCSHGMARENLIAKHEENLKRKKERKEKQEKIIPNEN